MNERAYKLGLVAIFVAAAVAFTAIGDKDAAGLSWLAVVLVVVLA